MSSRSRFITAILCVGVLSVALTTGQAQHAARPLERAWQVTELVGDPVPDDVDVTMEFRADGLVSGRGGCNRYTGAYVAAGDDLTVGRVAMTRRACPGQAMEVEADFADALMRVRRRDLSTNGLLTLRDADGLAIVTARPVDGTSD